MNAERLSSRLSTTPASRPWPGIVLSLAGAAALLISGASLWLTATITVLWIGSLLLSRPLELPPVNPTPPVTETRFETREAVIEPIGVPLLIVENDRVTIANAAARAALGTYITGQDARIALRHPSAMRLLDGPDSDSAIIPGFMGGRSLWQLTRRPIGERASLIELVDRTTEADVSRAQTDFVANASHELRTPLAAIIGYVETLVDAGDQMDSQTATRFHQIVLREAQRMQTLVSDLMSLSQVEAEKHDPPSEEIDLTRLVERVIGEVTAIAGRERVNADVPDQQTPLPGDRAQLEQLVRNLIDNALKYGDPSKPVEVTLTGSQAHGPVLTVRDRGPGIAPEHLPHLTRRFYRTDPGRSRAAGGTGLGLAIVKHIAERHRARLDIASTLGDGTTVTISFAAARATGVDLAS